MTNLDYLTLAVYLAGIVAITVFATRRTSSQKEMFSAGRRSPWWASGLSGFMTMFSANTFVVWGGIAYELGFVAVAINTCYGVAALLVGYFVAGKWNQLGVSTPAEFVQLRFGNTGLHFFTWTMLVKRILGVAASLTALAYLLTALLPMDLNVAIIVFGAIVVIYTMMGGLWAVLLTDVLQFVVLTVVVLLTAVLMLNSVESTTAYVDSVPKDFFKPIGGKYTWFFLLGWTAIHFFMIGAEWAFVQRFIAVRNPSEAKKSAWLFGVMYLVTPLFWLLPPLLYRGEVDGVDKKQAYILAAQSVLPPGMLGLMFAALFSATASMVSSQLNVFAGVLTNDFYKAFIKPAAAERDLVHVGRIFTVILGAMLVGMAILIPYLGEIDNYIIALNSLMVVPLFAPTLWGLFSRKIGIRDMMIVALVSFKVGALLKFAVAGNPLIEEGSALFAMKAYLMENNKDIDVLIGVVLPVLMLIGFELKRRGEDSGFKRVAERSAAAETEIADADAKFQFDPFPARMVMISLLVMGLWMFTLGFGDQETKTILLTFAGGLIVLAIAIQVMISRMTKS